MGLIGNKTTRFVFNSLLYCCSILSQVVRDGLLAVCHKEILLSVTLSLFWFISPRTMERKSCSNKRHRRNQRVSDVLERSVNCHCRRFTCPYISNVLFVCSGSESSFRTVVDTSTVPRFVLYEYCHDFVISLWLLNRSI